MQNLHIRITKIFSFEMAHALWNYQGKCKNIHGHSYKLHVTLSGKPLNKPGDPEDGMLMDFGKLKKLIKYNLIDQFDHAFVINENSPLSEKIREMMIPFENVKRVPYQPTSENLVIDFAKIIRGILPEHVNLYSLKLSETETSSTEWYSE